MKYSKEKLINYFKLLDEVLTYQDLMYLLNISKPTFYQFKKDFSSKKVLKRLQELYQSYLEEIAYEEI